MQKPFKTLWYKSPRDRIYVLFLWVVFLVAMNRQVYGGIDILLMLVLVISWLLLYFKFKLYINTVYEFWKDKITITSSKKKSYKLPIDEIEKITSIKNKFTITSLLNKYWFTWKVADYSTSIHNQLAIHMKDWLVVIISPRKINTETKKLYPFH